MTQEFTMNVYTRRHRHEDTYSIERTKGGWKVKHMMSGGDGDKTGFPGLKRCLEQDYVNYPAGIVHYFEKIWELLETEEIDAPQAQVFFNELGEWISTCEKSTPDHIYN